MANLLPIALYEANFPLGASNKANLSSKLIKITKPSIDLVILVASRPRDTSQFHILKKSFSPFCIMAFDALLLTYVTSVHGVAS